jgi:hypothetical protein
METIKRVEDLQIHTATPPLPNYGGFVQINHF